MELRFNEIIINSLAIDEDTFKEYLDGCKESSITPSTSDFLSWIYNNYYISDFIEHEDCKYTLIQNQFEEYLKNFNND